MRIFLVGPRWIGGWLEGVGRALNDLGHTLVTFRYDSPAAPSVAGNRMRVLSHTPSFLHPLLMPVAESVGRTWEGQMNAKIVKLARRFKPDLVLILKGESIRAETIRALRSPGRHIASWWLDDPLLYFDSHPQVRSQLQYLDTLFVYDRGRFKDLSASGARCVAYLPCAVDTSVYHPKSVRATEHPQYRVDIGFAATYYPERGKLLNAMTGLKVAIWGSGWKNAPEIKLFPKGTLRGKKLNGPQLAALYGVARISPNVHHSQTLHGGMNLRTFEIPASGGFELVDEVPGLEEHFDSGSEIVAYKSPEHFRELVDYYLSHPAERAMIIERGRARVLRDHTYLQRVNAILDVVNRKV